MTTKEYHLLRTVQALGEALSYAQTKLPKDFALPPELQKRLEILERTLAEMQDE